MRVRAGPQLQGPYARRPLERWAPKSRQHAKLHHGIQFENVHPLIGNLCIRPDGGPDVEMFRQLTHGPLSIDDAYDLAEIDDVARSWRDAAQANNEHASAVAARAAKTVR